MPHSQKVQNSVLTHVLFVPLGGQLLLSPTTLRCSDAEGPLLGSRILQQSGEPLLVTLLLPHRPSTSLLNHPSILQLTVVQHILVGSYIVARPSSKLVALGPFNLAPTSSWWAIRKTIETESGFLCLTKISRLIKSMTMMSMQ